MRRLTDNKIVLIRRKTRLEELIARHNTLEQARFYVEHLGGGFSDYQEEDTRYHAVLEQAVETLEGLGRVQVVHRAFLPNFTFGREDTVVAVGQDGLVANTLKYLDGQPLIAVNPDPTRWEGVLLPFEVGDLRPVVLDVFGGRRPVSQVSMAKASLSDGQVLYGVNDLFVGQRTHISSRYQISQGGFTESQSSSGIIVSTGLGATGWLKSVLAGALGVVGAVCDHAPALSIGGQRWDADTLHFAVREPYPSKATGASLVFGKVTAADPLTITSCMPENGVIFSDGVESDFLEFTAGIQASITLSEKKGQLVV